MFVLLTATRCREICAILHFRWSAPLSAPSAPPGTCPCRSCAIDFPAWAHPLPPRPPPQISKTYTHYGATLLFFIFGVRMLYEGATNDAGGESAELVEVEKELSHNKGLATPFGSTAALENGAPNGATPGKRRASSPSPPAGAAVAALRRIFSPVLLEAFTLTFLAEWGDRSQIATIGLAAASDVVGVTLGGILGHALCTGAAVLGGKHLATHIDERLVSLCGGGLFLLFAAHSFYSGVPE